VSDVFYELNDMRAGDGGKSCVGPTPYKGTLGRREIEEGVFEGICDFLAGRRYFLTLRNNDAGYVTWNEYGLRFKESRQWRFDDGSDVCNYNTQQHWVARINLIRFSQAGQVYERKNCERNI